MRWGFFLMTFYASQLSPRRRLTKKTFHFELYQCSLPHIWFLKQNRSCRWCCLANSKHLIKIHDRFDLDHRFACAIRTDQGWWLSVDVLRWSHRIHKNLIHICIHNLFVSIKSLRSLCGPRCRMALRRSSADPRRFISLACIKCVHTHTHTYACVCVAS